MSAQVISPHRLSSTSTYPKSGRDDATSVEKFRPRPRTPTFSSFIRFPNLSMPTLTTKPSMPFGLGRRCRSSQGTFKQETQVSDSPRSSDSAHRISSSQLGWRSSESSSSSPTSEDGGYHVPEASLGPQTSPLSVPPLGTKILERFWPENEPFSKGDADVSQQPLGEIRPGSLNRTQAFGSEMAVDDWTAGSGSGLGKEIPHRFLMLTPPPSRRVSRIHPLSTSMTAAQDLPFSDEFPKGPSVDHRIESEMRFPF
ncbi:hypothetical protein EDC04DRAFT_2652776 [Pisolithus marmoratus]|nr:hypothetical protein EDC04DRAFT_2652776 [Pisolithus marmoratus]